MLYADKRALETNLKVSLLQIRERELNFYTQNCLAVGTQSALLAGFAFAGLTQVSVPHDAHYAVKLLYLLFTTGAMSCELIAVLNTTLLSMLGPGLALRGPDGSMHKAVDGMMYEYRKAFFTFGLGLIAFHFSALLFGWLMFRTPVAISITLCVVTALYVLYRYVVRIFAKFQLPKNMVISGRFSPDTELTAPGASGVDAQEQQTLGRLISREQHGSVPAAGAGAAGADPPGQPSLGGQSACGGGGAGEQPGASAGAPPPAGAGAGPSRADADLRPHRGGGGWLRFGSS